MKIKVKTPIHSISKPNVQVHRGHVAIAVVMLVSDVILHALELQVLLLAWTVVGFAKDMADAVERCKGVCEKSARKAAKHFKREAPKPSRGVDEDAIEKETA